MSEHKNHILLTITLLVIGWGLLVVVNALRADWSGPTEVPPGGNPSSFLTSGSNAETKTGPLTISNNFFVTGNVNLGSTSIPTSARLVIDPYTNASIDAGSGFIRTGYIAAHDYDVINKAYLYSSLEASSYWILSTSTNSLYPTSTSWKVGIGTTNPGTAKLAVMGGNVGIGTTNPQAAMDVTGDVRFYDSTRAKYILLHPTANNQEIGTSAGQLNFVPASGSILLYKPSVSTVFAMRNSAGTQTISLNSAGISYLNGGNIGIGTTNPVSNLDVYGSNPRLSLTHNVLNTGSVGINFLLNNDSSMEKKTAIIVTPVGSYGRGNISFVLDSVADSNNYDYTVDTKMFIKNDGSVGIGTITPATKLHIYDASSGPIITLSGLDSNYRGLTIKDTENPAHEKWFVGNNASNNFVIRATGSNDILTVSSSTGNVGIGTTAPSTALHIYPHTNTEGLRIVSNDYSPLVIRNSPDTADLFRVNQSGDVTAVTSSATKMRSNNYCDADGTNCFNPSGGWNSVSYFATVTSSTYNGNNNGHPGYAYAHDRCKDQLAGSHVCTAEEILNTIRDGKTMPSVDVWIFNGPPGYTAMANDCDGRRSVVGSGTYAAYGSYWQMSDTSYLPHGRGLLYTCDKYLRFACCK